MGFNLLGIDDEVNEDCFVTVTRNVGLTGEGLTPFVVNNDSIFARLVYRSNIGEFKNGVNQESHYILEVLFRPGGQRHMVLTDERFTVSDEVVDQAIKWMRRALISGENEYRCF